MTRLLPVAASLLLVVAGAAPAASRITARGLDIFSVGVDGRGRRDITPWSHAQRLPSPAPDGRSLAYVDLGPGYSKLTVLRFQTRSVRAIAPISWDPYVAPSWSPGASRLVYTRFDKSTCGPLDRNCATPHVMLANVRTGAVRSFVTNAVEPTWSPDGAYLALAAEWESGEAGSIVLTRTDLRWMRTVAYGARVSGPSSSFDSRYVAFLSGSQVEIVGTGGALIWQSNLRTAVFSPPVWSPTQLRLAFESAGWLYVFDLHGRRLRRLGSGSLPAWSPSGSMLAFLAAFDRRPQLFVAKTDGTMRRLLVKEAALSNEDRPAWSRDGRTVYYVANADR